MIRVLNSLPTSFLPTEGQEMTLQGISLEKVKGVLMGGKFTSHIGHEATAAALSTLLGVEVAYSRAPAPSPQEAPGDTYIIASCPMPRRLGEGERLSEEEILAITPRWVAINL